MPKNRATMPTEDARAPEPADTLAMALLEAYQLPAIPSSNAYQAARQAFEAFLQGATCVDIAASALKGIPEVLLDVDDAKATLKPLVVRHGKLYLSRLDHLEEQVALQIKARLAPRDATRVVGAHWLPQPKANTTFTGVDQQKAVHLAVQSSFAVLTGGPGTGKTTTAACIIGATLETHGLKLEDIRLCAPTGRAASQLHGGLIEGDKALALNATRLGCADADDMRRRLPKSYTIHKFVRNPEMMAGAKLVVVDECSMVDLALFHSLLKLIPADARIVLIGDPQQLPSVDTGSVFADLCGNAQIQGHLVTLKEPLRAEGEAKVWYDFVVGYRNPTQTSHPKSGLEKAEAKAIIAASLEGFRAIAVLSRDPAYADRSATPSAEKLQALTASIKSVRILCAYHRGELGVRRLNETIRKELGLVAPDAPGSLVMITRNDHKVTDLSNGDVGLVVSDGLVWFPGKTVAIPFNQLPPNTPAFATTIHKSQGSEYDKVLLVLPPADKSSEEDGVEPFINKQLIFTGITRARRTIALFSTSETLYQALDTPAVRASGLSERLS